MAQPKTRRPAKTATAASPSTSGEAHWWSSGYFRALGALALLGAVVALVYGRAIHAPLVFDDGNTIVENPSIKQLWPLVGDAKTPGPLNPEKDFCTAGRPLPNLSLAINYHFSERYDPTGYHIFNACLHALNAWLLWAVLRRVFRLEYFAGRFDRVSEPLAILAALLWAVHPLQIDAVQYITQRTEMMMGFCYLATLLASLHYWQAESPPRRAAWLALAGLACLTGAACKEVMVSAPAMILLFERTFIASSIRQALRKSWPLYLSFLPAWGMILFLHIGGPRSETAGFSVDLAPWIWWCTQCKVLLIYIKLAVWPWPLVIHYEFKYLDTFAAAWPWVLTVALLAVATIVLVWRRTAAGFVLTWVVAILSPTLVVPIITEIAAERRMYLPMAGLVALFVAGGFELVHRLLTGPASRSPAARSGAAQVDRRAVTIVGAAGVLLSIGYCMLDARRLAMFETPLVLWQDALVHQPGSSISQFNVGITLQTLGRQQEAIPHFEEAIRIKPDDGGTHNNLGFALMMVGRTPEAIPHIEKAIALKPDSAAAQNNLGMALTNLGRPSEAIPHFQKALELKPKYAEAAVNLGVLLGRAGQPQAAVDQLEQALAWDPLLLDAFAPLTTAYMELGQTATATATAERAIAVARSLGRNEVAHQFTAWLAEHRSATPAK